MTNIKNLSKRGLSLLLVLVMCLGMLNLTAFAAEDAVHVHGSQCYVELDGVKVLTCTEKGTHEGPHNSDPNWACSYEYVLACDKQVGAGGHNHDENCVKTCILDKEGHTHTEECEGQVLVCGQDEVAAHTHNESCYQTNSTEELICTKEVHTHSNSCYDVEYETGLVCGRESGEGGHKHDSGCYTSEEVVTGQDDEGNNITTTENHLTCGLSEGDGGHVHDDSCNGEIARQGDLVCGIDEHTHSDACYETIVNGTELICGKEETNGHQHSEECWETGYVCGKEETEGHTCTEDGEGCVFAYSCGKTESEGHVHSVEAGCYRTVYTCVYQGLSIADCTCETSCVSAAPAEDGEGVQSQAIPCPVCSLTSDPELLALVCQGKDAGSVEPAEPEALTNFKTAVNSLESLIANGLTDDNIEEAKQALSAAQTALAALDEVELTEEQAVEAEALKAELETISGEIDGFVSEWTPVADLNGLKDVLQADSAKIKLTGDINNVSELNISKEVVIDLNGHKLQNGSITVVSSGNLTIRDSSNISPVPGTTETNGTQSTAGNAGKAAGTRPATYSDGTLTYYVTYSKVIGGGRTEESTTQYTVCNMGAIVAVPITVKGSLTLESGYLVGNARSSALIVDGGSAEMTGGVIAANTSGTNGHGGGIQVYSSGSFTMMDGIISGNTAQDSNAVNCARGGGIFLRDGTVTINGGYVTNNRSLRGDNANSGGEGGGGIGTDPNTNAKVCINGGYITGNWAGNNGGGISVQSGQLLMHGGTVANNYAEFREGGGIFVWSGSNGGEITRGYITNNSMARNGDWGGGGLMVATGTTFSMDNVLITDNYAEGVGGGAAGCATGTINAHGSDGMASYGNTAIGENFPGGVTNSKTESTDIKEDKYYTNLPSGYQSYQQSAAHGLYQDYYCHDISDVSHTMLGGGEANWLGIKKEGNSSNCKLVTTAENNRSLVGEVLQTITVTEGTNHSTGQTAWLGLKASPSDADKASAVSSASVFLTGNYSATHGGGFMCNGTINIGKKDSTGTSFSFELKGTKTLTGAKLENEEFTFALMKEEPTYNPNTQKLNIQGNPLKTVRNDANGSISFNLNRNDVQNGLNVFYVAEVSDQNPVTNIIYTTEVYKVTLDVEKDKKENIDICKVSGATLEVRDFADDSSEYQAVNVYTWTENGTNLSGLNFTNRYDVGKIPVSGEKKWEGDNGYGTRPDLIWVDLYANGIPVKGIPVTPDQAGNWKYSFGELPEKDEKGDEIVYTVKERDVPASYESTVNGWDITNTYQSGSLSIQKIVKGIENDPTEFTFTVQLNWQEKPLTGTFPLNINGEAVEAGIVLNKNGVGTVKLTDGQTAVISDLPVGTEYTVTEQVPAGYLASGTNKTGEIIKNETAAVVYTNTCTPNAFTPSVSKAVSGMTPPSTQEFTFVLADMDGKKLDSVTIEGAGSANFQPITYSKPGIYTYKITEEQGNAAGYTYDQSEWLLTVTVAQNYRGELVATGSYSKDGVDRTETAAFTNTYTASPASYAPAVVKTVEGIDNPTTEFTFLLAAEDSNPEGAVMGAAEVTITGNGSASFKDIVFTQVGVYVFKITEQVGSDTRYTYDQSVWTLTIEVEDEGGQLKVAGTTYVSDVADAKVSTEEASFLNTYTPPGNPGNPPGDPPRDPEDPTTPPETPEEDIPDDDTPLDEIPDAEIPMIQGPTTPENEEDEEILDEDVPLSVVPQTGDGSGLWFNMGLVSALGLAVLTFLRKREK